MSTIHFSGIEFHYDAPYTQVFEDLELSIDTSWKTALVGRNGRGKSTLLRLLRGDLLPQRGEISMPGQTAYFPYEPADPDRPTLEVVRECIAPFAAWESRMEQLLDAGGQNSLDEYGELLERYQNAGGYSIDAAIEREFADLGIPARLLAQNFSTLSGGEKTRALIVALFLKDDTFPLIDEPTNHLDMEGRELLAGYLARKRGFILVSHDRTFLDRCSDHVVSINRSDVRVHRGNYSSWKAQFDLEEEHERRRNDNLKREINALEEAARQRRSWSFAREKEKQGAPDKGFVGHRAAKQMKRALHIEERMEEMIEQKKGLLNNSESGRDLLLEGESGGPEIIVTVADAAIDIGERRIIERLSFTLRRGERVAIVGPNGSGKTTLLAAIAGEIPVAAGVIHMPAHISAVRAYQHPIWNAGSLRGHLREAGIDETKFRNIMGAFGVAGSIFDRPLETFSQGERKKADLCRSFLSPAHILIWDEPMNYIDLMSREQIERVLLRSEPTMLFVEHDRRFVEGIATRVVELPRRAET